MPGRRRNHAIVYAAVAVMTVVAALAVWLLTGDRDSGERTSPRLATPVTTAHVAKPAGATPSESAVMICAPEAQKDVAKFLGQATTAVTAPTWVDHVYSCRYAYANAAITLSVKELSNKSQTTAFFSSLAAQLGVRQRLKDLGQGAFVTSNGSLVLRKDYKVLLVDTWGVPRAFGVPPQPKKDIAIGVALTILGCWTGA
jgi:hypothetical protein